MNNLLIQDISNNAYPNQELFLNNLLIFSNNYMQFLNTSTHNVNTLISSIINTNNQQNLNQQNAYQQNLNQQNAYQQNLNQQNAYQQNAYQQNAYQQNAYLLHYKLADFEKLSDTNVYAIIKTATEKVFYGDIENPNNDSCSITQEVFSIYDNVTIIKECGHIYKSIAIEKWLKQHQTCPNCRHNILTDTNIISYINPETNKHIFLYNNEFRFYLALHIETLLSNREGSNIIGNNNVYEFGVFLR